MKEHKLRPWECYGCGRKIVGQNACGFCGNCARKILSKK